MNRDKEIEKVLTKFSDSYEFTVVFRRQLSEDLNCGGKAIESNVPVGKALLDQFVTELQSAYDQCGIAGSFQVVSGPSVSLGNHNMENCEYVAIESQNPKRCDKKDLVTAIADRLIGIDKTVLTTAERQILDLLVESGHLVVVDEVAERKRG